MGEMSEVLLGSQRVIPRVMIDRGFEYRFPNLGEALNDLLA
jgi:NAD dependent epimerase/dehydratase family enzyme